MMKSDALRAGLGAFLLCLLALALKSPDALGTPQFWAEDGAVFFAQQWPHAWPQLFSTYAGYLHFIDRSCAWIALAFPVQHAPDIYNGLALTLDAACIAYLLARIAPLGIAPVALAAIIFAPTNGEIFGNLTNTHWFTQLFLFACCFLPSTETGTARKVLVSVFVLAAALSGPFSIFLAALCAGAVALSWAASALGRETPGLSRLRSTFRACRVAPLVAGAALQLAFLLRSPPEPSTQTALLKTVISAIGNGQAHLFGYYVMGDGLFLASLVGMAILLVAQRLPSGLKTFLLLGSTFSLMQIAAAALKAPELVAAMAVLANGDRYYFSFKLFWWCNLFAIAASLYRSHGSEWPKISVAAILLFVALMNRNHLQRPPLENKNWPAHARLIQEGREVRVPINPTPWEFHIEARPGNGSRP